MARKKSGPRGGKTGDAAPGPERIQKILARAGHGSRRACEMLILDGRVKVDGQVVTELGAKADIETQELKVDNKLVKPERAVYYLLNKPKGTLCTLSDPQGRMTVEQHVPDERRRIFPVGRLDMDSRGAVILTNDGRFTNLLTHPRYGVEKTYLARVRGFVDDPALGKLRTGVWLAEGRTLPARIWVVKRKLDETELGIAICEGKNRQVRRMLAAVGYKCQGLTRTRIGPLTLKGLREGEHRELTKEEVEELEKIAKKNAGAPPPPWAKGRASRARAKGKPDPIVLKAEQERRKAAAAEAHPGERSVDEAPAPRAPRPGVVPGGWRGPMRGPRHDGRPPSRRGRRPE
jgi:23S rRNA pseudouridine2605 synthase